jgi:hypothetical protein
MKIFETKDFYLSGFLLCKGYRLIDNVRESGFTVFSFQDNPELQQIVSKYYKSEATIDPAVYGMTLRQLKGVMHNSVSIQNQVNNNEFNNNTKGSN